MVVVMKVNFLMVKWKVKVHIYGMMVKNMLVDGVEIQEKDLVYWHYKMENIIKENGIIMKDGDKVNFIGDLIIIILVNGLKM